MLKRLTCILLAFMLALSMVLFSAAADDQPVAEISAPESTLATPADMQGEPAPAVWIAFNAKTRSSNAIVARADGTVKLTHALLARAFASGSHTVVTKLDGSVIYQAAASSASDAALLLPNAMTAVSDVFYDAKKMTSDLLTFPADFTPAEDRPTELWVISVTDRISGKHNGDEFTAANIRNACTDYVALLDDPNVTLHFVWINEGEIELPKGQRWLDEVIAEHVVDPSRFHVHMIDPEALLADPMLLANALYHLEISSQPVPHANGSLSWQHSGTDSLLTVTASAADVSISSAGGNAQGPVLFEISEGLTWILFKNCLPGAYEITLPDEAVCTAHFDLPDGATVLTALNRDNTPVDAGLSWHYEDTALLLQTNLIQLPENQFTLEAIFNDGETLSLDTRTLVSPPDAPSYVWSVVIPKREIGSGSVTFRLSAGDYTLTSPTYAYTTANREPVAVSEAIDLYSYYNVPGIGGRTASWKLTDFFTDADQHPLTFSLSLADVENSSIEINNSRLLFTAPIPPAESDPLTGTLSATDNHQGIATVHMQLHQVDFTKAAGSWRFALPDGIDPAAIHGMLNQPVPLTFTLDAASTAHFDRMGVQYPMYGLIPLQSSLRVTATLSTAPDAEHPVTLTRAEDGSLVLTTEFPAYTQKTTATITFHAELIGIELPDLIPDCTLLVENDVPVLKTGVPALLDVKATISGAPSARQPLLLTDALSADENGYALNKLIPADLFEDVYSLNGLSCTITADRPELVRILQNGAELSAVDGMWTLTHDQSIQPCEIYLLNNGDVTVTIEATDGEFTAENTIAWTVRISSSYDLIFMLIIIGAALIVIAIVVLLVLRQVRKPSFKGYRITLNDRRSIPLDIYHKGSANLAQLFIGSQCPPLTSLPVEMLCDVLIFPEKGGKFRLCGSKRQVLSIQFANAAPMQLGGGKDILFTAGAPIVICGESGEAIKLFITQGAFDGSAATF